MPNTPQCGNKSHEIRFDWGDCRGERLDLPEILERNFSKRAPFAYPHDGRGLNRAAPMNRTKHPRPIDLKGYIKWISSPTRRQSTELPLKVWTATVFSDSGPS